MKSIPSIITTSPIISKKPLSLDTTGCSAFSTCANNSPSQKYTTSSFARPVLVIEPGSKRLVEFLLSSHNTLVLDVRPFNMYLASHLQSAHNICIPTTLLKRSSYNSLQVINTSSLPSEVKSSITDSQDTIRLLIYDQASTDTQLLFQLYQTVLKFITSDRFDVYILRGGFQDVPRLLTISSLLLELPARLPISPRTPRSANMPQGSPSCGTSDNIPFLSGFTLPSASSADHKFLMSIKKNLPKLDTNSSYNYNFKYPENFEKDKHKLPKWLLFFAEVDGEDRDKAIVDLLSDKFNRLEKTEQVRLSKAISNTDALISAHSSKAVDKCLHETSGYGTPQDLCPCCDKIDYSIPRGVEYGYKNRYHNVWPYEHSRVRLITSPSNASPRDGDDYFNANYIHFPEISERKYIATQNPLEATKGDFWNSVWHNGVKGIICLDNSLVFGRQAYYENDQYIAEHRLQVRIAGLEEHDDFVVRTIVLSKGSVTRKVYHFAYAKWPDFGTPDDIASVVKMMHAKDDYLSKLSGQRPPTSKISQAWDLLVHCSAGCGRTGCFIALDMVISCFQENRSKAAHEDSAQLDAWGDEDLIYKLIQFQRQQRISMVQNLDQFIFCYESILTYFLTEMV